MGRPNDTCYTDGMDYPSGVDRPRVGVVLAGWVFQMDWVILLNWVGLVGLLCYPSRFGYPSEAKW